MEKSYPARISTGFLGVPLPPESSRTSPNGTRNFFQNYRNENISRLTSSSYHFDDFKNMYSPQPDLGLLNKNGQIDRILQMEPPLVSVVDRGRFQEIEDYYLMCQKQRDYYKDNHGRLHPFDYFTKSEPLFQCAPDLTETYLQIPTCYTQYKQPITGPLTLKRAIKHPILPDRALTGVYNATSDNIYKR